MLKNSWRGEVLGCSSSMPFQNLFPSSPCPKWGRSTWPVCYSPCCTSGKKPHSTPEQVVSLPCPLRKKSVPIRKRCSPSLKTMKLILDRVKNWYWWPKRCLLKFATFLQERAGKQKVILRTAHTCMQPEQWVYFYLIASRWLHFTDCRANPSFFPTP